MGAQNKQKTRSQLFIYIELLSTFFTVIAGILKSVEQDSLFPLFVFGLVAIVLFLLLNILIENKDARLLRILAFTIPITVILFVLISVISLFAKEGTLCNFRNNILSKAFPSVQFKCHETPLNGVFNKGFLPESGLKKFYSFDFSENVREQRNPGFHVPNRFGADGKAIKVGKEPVVFLEAKYTDDLKEVFKGSFSLNFWLKDATEAANKTTNYSILYLTKKNTSRPIGFWIYKEKLKGCKSSSKSGPELENS